jgi:TonB-linked SusC/RagA family outer membrane protein
MVSTFVSRHDAPSHEAPLARARARLWAAAALVAVLAQPAFAQTFPVTGRVTSADGQILVGVTVQVFGTEVGALTNTAGVYQLNAPNATARLVFTMLGYQRQEVEIAGRARVDVIMATDALRLDEIVVVGYGAQAREVVSGSVGQISAADISRTSATTTASALVGKVAGINTRASITPSLNQYTDREPRDGRPGASTVLQIRNLGEPLFVVDGVPVSPLEFNQLNATDIENISVLKDASASVYGFRAANGVVLVTTKRGSAAQSRPVFQFDTYYGWQNLDRGRSPFGYANSALQFKYGIVESQQNLGQPRTITREELENYRIGAPGYESFEAWNGVINNPNAPQYSINTSLSGGTPNATYYMSLGRVSQDYVMKDNNFNRTNFQANLRTSVFDNLTFGTELRGRLEGTTNVALTQTDDPFQVYFQVIQSTWPYEDWWANGNPNFIRGDVRYLIRSPATLSRDVSGTIDQIRRNFAGNFWLEYALPFNIRLKGTYSHIVNQHQWDLHRYTYDAYCYDKATDTYRVCDTYQGQERRSARDVGKDNFGQLQVTHTGTFGSHTLSSVAAVELSGGETTSLEVRSVPPTNYSDIINFVNVTSVLNNWTINRRASFVGRVNYDYQQKYLVEALGRYDGSYLYAPSKRWGLFPGVTLGWRLTEEAFFTERLGIGFFDELKLRASWGQAGREQGISDWGYLSGANYGVGTGAVLDNTLVTGVRPRGLPVTNLSWVTSTTTNFGVDFAVLNSRLSGEFDLFQRKLTGLPAPRYDVTVPLEVGYTLPNENLESEANVGIEGIVRYQGQIASVGYTIAPNFTLARRKILDRYNPQFGNSWLEYRNGTQNRWADATAGFLPEVIGQFQSMEEIANHPVDIDGQGNRTLLPGDWILNDVNGDGIINTLDYRVHNFSANTPPVLSYGLNGTLSYRAFTLSYDFAGGSLFTYAPNNDLFRPYSTDHNGAAYIWSRWRRADPYNDNSEWIPGKYPPVRKAQTNHISQLRTNRADVNISYLRLKRAELAYAVPEFVSERLGLAGVRIYASAANPWLLTNLDVAFDPEQRQNAGQTYPTASVVNIGMSARVGGR